MKRLAEERERRLKREEEERLAFLREQEREQVEVRECTFSLSAPLLRVGQRKLFCNTCACLAPK
jgi:hypothetical protein